MSARNLASRIPCFGLAFLLGTASIFPVFRTAEAQTEQTTPSTNVYLNDDAFDEQYDAIAQRRSQGKFAEAFGLMQSLLKELETARSKTQRDPDGESRRLVGRALYANLLRDLNRNDESIVEHEALLKEVNGRNTLAERMMYLELQQNYGQVLANAGRAQESFAQLRDAISGYDELTKTYPDNPDIRLKAAIAGSNLGALLVRTGGLTEAVQVFESAMVTVRSLPEDQKTRNQKLSLLCLNQAVALSYLGNHLKARERVEECLALKTRLGEVDSQEVIQAQITLGAILGRLNQFQESDQAYAKAIDTLRQRYPVDQYPSGSVDLAIALDNRGVSLSRLGEFQAASEHATEANRMFAALSAKSPGLKLNYARSSASLSLLNARLMRHEIAIENLVAAIETYEAMFPSGHFELPGLYRSKAIILSELRRESESIAAIERALDLGRQFFPADAFPNGHWVVAQTLDTAGTVALAADQPELAAKYFRQAVEMQRDVAEQVLRYVSEAEALQFLAIADEFKSRLLSVPTEASDAFRLITGEKSRILDQQKSRFALARQSRDPEMAALYTRYEKVRGALARSVLNPRGSGSPAQQSQLQKSREQLERQLATADMSAEESTKNVDDVLAQLDEESAVVEFFSYERYSINDEGKVRRTEGKQHLAAFVLDGKTKQIRRIEFGLALPLRQDVRRLTYAMQFGTEQEALQAVSESLCSPLLAALPMECRRVAIVADGIVGGIPFSCLIDPESSKPLVDRFEIRFCTTLDSALREAPVISTNASVLAVGEVDYGPVDPNGSIEFRPLPGSGDELRSLKQQFASDDIVLLSGESVSADTLLPRLSQADVVHLATHGYVTDFARRAVTNGSLESGAIRTTADQRSPLLATRIALSGANQISGESVVTGEQFASVDLTNNQLVVLSACESGVGERVLGEGVFGLQRAFHIAGARHVVATLWPVSDQDAVELMDQFYRVLLQQQCSPAKALRLAQLEMMNQRSDGQRSNELGSDKANVRRGIRFDIPEAKRASSNESQPTDPSPETLENSSKSLQPTKRSTWSAFFVSVD